jgi:hypothetical protein
MGRINGGRLIVGGLVAAVVIFIFHMIFHVIWGGRAMAAFDAILIHPVMVTEMARITAVVLFLVEGYLFVWLYVAARPRLGAGPATAVKIGIVAGVLTFMIPNLWLVAITGVNPQISWIDGMWGVVSAIVATLAGAAIYQET